MIVAIHQPQYLPWLGYFDKIDRADLFVFLDTVQYKKNEWQNRNRIKTAQGVQWLTVPVLYRFPERILEVGINPRVNWSRKHLQALRTNYAKARFFERCFAFFEALYAREWERLVDLNVECVRCLTQELGIDTPLRTASEFELSEEPTERLIDICRAVGADRYLAGSGGRAYMDLPRFEAAGIEVLFQVFGHPVYPQLFGAFEPNLSLVDLLFNCGEESLRLIRGTREEEV